MDKIDITRRACLAAGVAGLAGGLLYDYHKRTEDTAYQRGYQAGSSRRGT